MSSTVRAAPRDNAARATESAAPVLRVVEEVPTSAPRERRTTVGALGVVLVGCLFIAVFGMVVFQVLLVQTQSRLDVLDGQVSAQEARSGLLDRQRADLESPDRIVAAARRLNMIAPTDVVHLQPGASDDGAAAFDANAPAPKAVTPTTKPAPPTTKAVTPTTKATTPTTKAVTPTTKATTPTTKARTATTKATATR